MNKDNLLILLLASALLLAAVFTIIRGGARSKHGGYGLVGPSAERICSGLAVTVGFMKVDSGRYRV